MWELLAFCLYHLLHQKIEEQGGKGIADNITNFQVVQVKQIIRCDFPRDLCLFHLGNLGVGGH